MKRANHAAKGKDFEQEVAEYMKKKLGYTDTQLNERLKLNEDTRPWECDIHGRRYSMPWENIRKLGIVFATLSMLILLSGQKETGLFFLVLAIGVGLVSKVGKSLDRSVDVWVECKNLKSTVKRDHINKLVTTISEVKRSKNAEWKPQAVLFFSASGYDKDAIYFAKRNNIICYRKHASGFERVN